MLALLQRLLTTLPAEASLHVEAPATPSPSRLDLLLLQPQSTTSILNALTLRSFLLDIPRYGALFWTPHPDNGFQKCGHVNLLRSLLTYYREVRFSILRSVEAVTPTRDTPTLRCCSAHQLLPRSRLLSLWVTHDTSLAFLTT